MNKLEFIRLSENKHGKYYDYSKTEYVRSDKRVIITCPKHGDYETGASSHYSGLGKCKKCFYKKRIYKNIESIQNKLFEIYGDEYTYLNLSENLIVSIDNYLTINCKKHGDFKKTIYSHISRKEGCPECSSGKVFKLDTKKFIERAKKIHGDLYNYDKVIYKNDMIKIIIGCKKHGDFLTTPGSHVRQKSGCGKCNYGKFRFLRAKNSFIDDSNKIHNFKYDYSEVVYVSSIKPVVITCKKHGNFELSPADHKNNKVGCPNCKCSKGEDYISKELIKYNIVFVKEKKFKDCISPKNAPLRFDFYLPEYDSCIEYDGIGHFQPISFSSKESQETIDSNFEIIKIHDSIKDRYCENNNIRLIRIPYTSFNSIPLIIEKLNNTFV